MSINYFKNKASSLTVMGLTLFALSMVNTITPMEKPYRVSTQTNCITHDDGISDLALVRHYLSNRKNTISAITETLTQQNKTFTQIDKAIARLKPTTTLTPQLYIAFEEKAEKSSGPITRTIRKMNTDADGMVEGDTIHLTAAENGTFKIKLPKKAQPKGNVQEISHPFNEPIENLDPSNPGYYFILKGNSIDKKTCLHLLKTISQLNKYIRSRNDKKQDIPNNIKYPCDSEQDKANALTLFTQKLYNQAQALRLLHTYDSSLAKNSELANLTKKLPRDLIAKDATLSLLQKITIECKFIYETCKDAQNNDSSVSPKLFENAQNLLSQWTNIFDQDKAQSLCAEQILTRCDNWLPAIKEHARIENKAHTDNKKNDISPDNHYANGQRSNEPIRYNPGYWLNQCPNDNNKLIGKLYNCPHTIPVINNMYINSPLMIDNFALKYGVKTKSNNDGFSYALKGKIFILLLNNQNRWMYATDKNTGQPFCIEKTFTCAVNTTRHNNAYEVFHRGHECSDKMIKDIIDQCYVETSTINENWFRENDASVLAHNLDHITSQQTETDTANNRTINKYSAQRHDHNYGSYYEDCFGNIVTKVTDSSITIWMPDMNQRKWTMEIILEKPNKLNLL